MAHSMMEASPVNGGLCSLAGNVINMVASSTVYVPQLVVPTVTPTQPPFQLLHRCSSSLAHFQAAKYVTLKKSLYMLHSGCYSSRRSPDAIQ